MPMTPFLEKQRTWVGNVRRVRPVRIFGGFRTLQNARIPKYFRSETINSGIDMADRINRSIGKVVVEASRCSNQGATLL